MAKKTLKRKNTTREVEKPSSIFFADYSNSKPDHITPVARPMFLAPEYDANAVLRTAGTNIMDVKLTPEEEKKLKKVFKKIDYSKITDKGQIIDTAIDQILGAEDDLNKKNQLQTLLRMTNYMENKYGANNDAWNNKKTNFGFVELDKVAIDDLFTPGGANGNFTKGQKNAFQYLKNFGLPTDQKELEKLLLNNDPLANMAVSRLVYASNPKPLPDMNDQKAVFNYWLNDYNHRGALKHQTEEDLFNIFQEGYKTYNTPSYKPKITITPEGHAVIDDNRGQWAYPGEVTRINASAITMAGVPYPVLGVGADGEQRMMYPNEEHTFNEAPVTEYPMMQAKDGGWLSKYEKGSKVKPIIVTPEDPRLKSYQDSLNTYNVSNNFNKEYEIVPVTESNSDEAKKFIEHSKKNNLPYKDAFYSPKIGIVYGTPPKKPVRKVLTEGSEGANNVRKQEELVNAGYDITVDGAWGNQSQKAWDDYQERLNPKKQQWEPNQEDLRADGTQKGTGYFGVLQRPDGGVSTEISVGVTFDGKEVEVPLIVPTLSQEELNYLLVNPVDKKDLLDTPIGKSIMDKAVNFSKQRATKGLSPFYQEGEPRQTVSKQTPTAKPSFPPGATAVPDNSLVGDWSAETKKQKGLRTLKEKYRNTDGVLKTRQTVYDSNGNVLETREELPGNFKRGGVTWLNEYQDGSIVMPPDVMTDPRKLAQWMKDHPEFHANANTPVTASYKRSTPYATSDNTNVVINTPKGPVNTGTRNAPNVQVPGGGVSKNTVKDIEILLDLAEFYPPTAIAAYIAGVPFTVMDLYDDYKKGSQPAEYVLDALGLIPGEKLGSKAASELLNLANFGVDVKDYPEKKYGGKTFSAGGEKHKVYKKESPTGNGEGVKGHIMVTHPTMDKGKWDTIDLTEKSGAKTVAQGVAATRKWHRENPEYEEGGPINSAENPESLPQVNIQGTVPDWAKDRKKYGKDEINFWESFNPKKWGLNDYSDYSSFNSAFRNASESNENEFVYKGKRYNTQRVNQEASDAYNNQKQWLADYIKTNTPNPLLDSKQKEEYYKNYVSQVSPEGTNDNNKELVQVDNFTNYTRDQKVQQQLEKLNTPYYFSITNQKPADMHADGYTDIQKKKIFFNTNPQEMPEGLNTAYLHELSHKSENSDDVLHTVPIVDVDLMKQKANGNYVNEWSQKTFNYVSRPTEVQARKMSTLYYLDQNKMLNRDASGKVNITKEQLDQLYGKNTNDRKNIPYDISQLLDLYTYQRDDLLNYLNNDFSKYKNRWNTPDKKKYGGKINGYQIGGTVNLASPEYAEYQFFQSLQSSPTNIAPQQITAEEPEIQTAPVSEKRMKGYNETLLTKLKELINPESAKDFEGTTSDDLLQLGTRGRQRGLTRASIFDKPEDIDFSELDRQQRPTSKQEQITRQNSSYTKEEPLPQGTPAISNPLGKKAYAALVKELRKDPSTADDALNIAKLLLAQSAQETGQWTSPAALQAGNLSGIKFYNQKGRRPSSVLAPASEENGYRRPYVQYDSPEDWASSMIQLMKGRYKDALYSKTPEEYAARLRARGYYTGSQDVYAKNMRAFFRQFKFE